MKYSSITKSKTALITGASKRIGRAIALAFADSGYNIIIHYRSSKKEAEKLQSEIIKKNVAAWTLEADLGKTEENESLIRRAFALGRGLCVLVNNASIFPQSFALSAYRAPLLQKQSMARSSTSLTLASQRLIPSMLPITFRSKCFWP